jgi:pectate lyase
MIYRSLFIFSAIYVTLLMPETAVSVPAFPGAEGFGAQSIGGRGGKVLFVTNINDSGPGSLREAVETEGPRIVIFRISGTIALKSAIAITKPYITIAGQTAPGDGICLKNHALVIAASHVIVRYIRCRPGDNAKAESDSISISSGRDIIVDHCSASWSVDETLSASSRGQLGNVTVQWCIISESLDNSIHHKGSHGYGSLIRGSFGNGYTYHHNLYAHHHARLPRPGNYVDSSRDPEGFILDFRNNVIYNWAGDAAGYNSDGPNGTNSITKMNFIGNYYKAGTNSTGSLAFSERTHSARAWFSRNCMNGNYPDDPWSLVSFNKFSDEDTKAYKQSEPIPVPAVKTDDAIDGYKRILAEAGAVLPKRDAVDIRIVNEVKNGTGKIINDEQQVGGWPELKSAKPPQDSDRDGMPDDWEKQFGFDPDDAADGNGDSDSDGYTNLEEYLNNTKP